MSDETVDVLIVGAGAAGAAFAWSMADTRMNILCLEQGDWMDPGKYPTTGTDWEMRRFSDFGFSPNSRGRSEDYPINDSESPISISNFKTSITSIISSSIRLDISIIIVSIVIIGGMGSIPGVALGAIVLVGLPELFREFSEYRFLLYGLALILVMRWKPEGLLPSKVGRQEMHKDVDAPEGEPSDHSPDEQKGAPAGATET